MRRIHVDTYEKAWQELRQLKADASGPPQAYKIVKSPYKGYEVVVIDRELYAGMLADRLIDGRPSSLPFRKVKVGELT